MFCYRHETALGLLSRLDLNDLLTALVARAGQLVGTPHGFIYLVESFDAAQDRPFDGVYSQHSRTAQNRPADAVLECKVGVGVFSRTIGLRLASGEGLSGKVWQTGQPLIIDDYDTWSGRSPGLETDLSPEQCEFTETIRQSGDTLLTIINDILDFSKIEAGKMDLEDQPFDVRNCVEGALDLLATQAAEKGLDLAYLVEPQIPAAISGDVTRLRQILVNLLDNAVRFTERGEIEALGWIRAQNR